MAVAPVAPASPRLPAGTMTVDGVTQDRLGTVFSPSTADKTDMAGVMIESP
jgi:hypothetical protein